MLLLDVFGYKDDKSEARYGSFLTNDDFLGLWQICELWRPEFCCNEAIKFVMKLLGASCVVIQAKFCRYVGRLWVGTCRSVAIGFSDDKMLATFNDMA